MDKSTFLASLRVMFDNCMAYNKIDKVTKSTYWLREPCKLLIRELTQLSAELGPTPGKADFEEVLRKLKLVRLAGYLPYEDFERNPTQYYPDYGQYVARPMGIQETRHTAECFDSWCQRMIQVFDDAMTYHSQGRGSVFIHYEANFLKRDFLNLSKAGRELLERGGSPSELVVDPPMVEEEGVKIFTAEETKMPNDMKQKCRNLIADFRRFTGNLKFHDQLERRVRANTFVRIVIIY